MVDYMENNHINKSTINWVEFRANVQQSGTSAARIADANEAILYALELLNDQTTFMITAQGQLISFETACTDVKPQEVTSTADIGYVKVPAFSGTGVSAAVFAEKIQTDIKTQDHDGLKGWVIDLRENTGGNIWPMIAGVGPLLDSTTTGFFVDSNQDEKPFGYSLGSATFDESPVVTVANPYVALSGDSKIAILLDHSVTNAGEVVAIAFSGMTSTRSFGASTCGRARGNQGFQLSDGSVLYLATSFLIDRDRVNKLGPIVPDEVVTDPTLTFSKAIEWINN